MSSTAITEQVEKSKDQQSVISDNNSKNNSKQSAMTTELTSKWRCSLIEQLNARTCREQKPFDDLINFCGKLFESIALYPLSSAGELTGGYGKYAATHGGSSDSLASDQSSNQLSKLCRLQEELSRLLEGKNDQTLIIEDLKQQLDTKEKEKGELYAKFQEVQGDLNVARTELAKLERTIAETKQQLQFERDEHQALRLLYENISHKYVTKSNEAELLLNQLKAFKAADAERMNEINEREEKILREKQRKDLEAAIMAADIHDTLGSDDKLGTEDSSGPIYAVAVIPERMLAHADAHDGDVYALKWSLSDSGRFKGELLATGGSDRKVKLWQLSSSTLLLKDTLIGCNGGITSIDTEGDCLLASSYDFATRLWSISDGKLRRTLSGHADKVWAAKFLGIPNKAATGSQDRTVRIWDIEKCLCTKTLYPGSTCYDLVCRKGQDIISAHFDKRIRFWDIRADSSAQEIMLQGRLTSLDISPNGYYLLACVRDDTLQMLDFRMNQVVKTFCADGFKVGSDISRASFSPDSDYVVAGSSNGSVFIWNVNSSAVMKNLKNHHTTSICSASWSPQGHVLASAEKNKKVLIWS